MAEMFDLKQKRSIKQLKCIFKVAIKYASLMTHLLVVPSTEVMILCVLKWIGFWGWALLSGPGFSVSPTLSGLAFGSSRWRL